MDPMRRDWDAIVVGLGGIGSAAAYWLSRALGEGVLGLERFELDHVNGASADHSRIIRLSYHRPDYVRLAKRAYETWAEVERDAGERIVTVTGGLDLWPADPAIPMVDYTDSLTAEGVPFELLDGAEVRQRWPQWRVGDELRAMWQREGGLADPFRGNAAHRRLARANGATLRDRSPVTSVRDAGGGDLEVVTPDATYRTGRVVLAADAWTNELLASFERRLPLTVTKEQVTYFACPDPAAFAPDRFPVWIWMDEPCFYGFPTYGEAGPKAAQDCGGRPVEPADRTFERDEAAFAQRRALHGEPSAGRARPADLHQDLPLHAHPGSRLRGRSPARGAGRDRGARGRARVQVRLGPRPDHGRAAGRRGDPIGRRSRPIPDRSTDPARDRPRDLLDGLIRAGARYGSTFAPNVLLCHRTASFGRGRAPPEGDFVCDSPCVPGRRASSPW